MPAARDSAIDVGHDGRSEMRIRRIALGTMLAAAMTAGLALTLAGCGGGGAGEPAVSSQEAKVPAEVVTGTAVGVDDAPDGIAAPSTTGALHVEGAQLASADGRPVQLRGVSTHGLAWFPQYVNQPFFDELRQDWGANVVRLAMYTVESGGYCTDGDQAELERLMADGVAYATEADLYVVVDWHILSDVNPLQHVDEAKAFFARMSAALSDHNNVIYEICNEPNGDATWADVKAYADEVIPAIRANAPDAVVVVGTPTWSQRIDEAAADPLAFDNVMYALHFYAATHQQDLRDRLAAAVDAGLPVFVSEFGICDASGNGRIDYDSADAWVRLMDELGVSYICWNLSNKDEASALFRADCAKSSGFDEADLSAEGIWLQGVLRGKPAREDASAAGSDAAGNDSPTASDNADGQGAAHGGVDAGSVYSGSIGDLAFAAHVINSWEAGGKACEQYSVTLTSRGADIDGWEITVPLGRPFTLADSWNGQFDVRGTDLHIANVGYNETVGAGASVSDVGFIVSY